LAAIKQIENRFKPAEAIRLSRRSMKEERIMKNLLIIVSVLLFVGIVAYLGIAGAYAEREVKVALKDVPEAVRATIEKAAGGARIAEITREVEDGETIFEAEFVKDGKEIEIEVSESGKLLETERDDFDDNDDEDEDGEEQEVAWNDLPEPVRNTLSGLKESGMPVAIKRERENGFVVYEAEYAKDGRKREIELSENGDYLEVSESVSSSDLPAALLGQIAKRYPGSRIKSAERVVLTYFEIEIDVNGKTREVHLLANGAKADDDDDDDYDED
jgi:uncharacterized membrane protein YkoI